MKALAAVVTLFLLAGLAQAQDVVEYYHLDGLGSVRAISDQAGNLVERHDYLPFGEECVTGSCSANPGAGGGQARKFTGKERDGETGLDYFESRYYGSRLGRFTTVDPVRVLAAVADPQQWNRYSYARDNPLRYLDPHGLYVFEASATNRQRDAFRDALRDAGRARNNLSGADRAAVSRGMDAYGAEGDANGVTVGFGSLNRGEAGSTGGQLNPNTLKGDITVTFDLAQSSNLFIDVAHEGSHAADYQAYFTALVADPAAFTGSSSVVRGPLDLTKYETEKLAYSVSALTALGSGSSGLSVGGQQILRNRRVDMAAIDRLLASSSLYRLTPANPGARLSGQ